MTLAAEETQLAAKVLASAEGRAVYTDWLLERDDPRGALLVAAEALAQASGGPAKARADARLGVVAALKRLASWLDGRVPEGKPWRPADVRGVTSEALGFLSHERGVLRRLRVAPGRETPLPVSLGQALPTVTELGVPAAPPGSARLGAEALHPVRLLDALGADALRRYDCLDLELPGALPRLGARRPDDEGWRFHGLGAALQGRERPIELRLFDGSLEVDAFAALLAEASGASMVWLDRVRLAPETGSWTGRRPGRVPHLRFTETPVPHQIARALAGFGALEGLTRLELKDWPFDPPALEALLSGAPQLAHLGVVRSPMGPALPKLLDTTGRLAQLETLDASGCLLGLEGTSALLLKAPASLTKLVLRFNQLTERHLVALTQLERWPRAEVRLEEVTFGPEAHQALGELARAHRLQLDVAGCVVTLRSSNPTPRRV
ncbi:MAG: hypothetical protein SFW67_14160 [Myxococcaceae bacterium]|nr:hypothetical protein [Myxococcaceae bacterium]